MARFVTSLFHLLAAMLLTAATTASAQSTISAYSSTSRTGQAIPSVCQEQMSILHGWLDTYPHPPVWTYVVACDGEAWRRILTHLGVVDTGLPRYGETALEVRMSFFRGPTLLARDQPQATSEQVVAHELSPIFLQSGEESRVDANAASWMRAVHAQHSTALRQQAAMPGLASLLPPLP